MSTTETARIDCWGQVGHLTETQEAALREFSERASPADLECVKFKVESLESVSLRYLRARSFSAERALAMLSESAAKKIADQAAKYGEMHPDECVSCDADMFKNWYPHGQHGYDKMNRPILFEHSGGIQPAVLNHMLRLSDLVKYHWWTMEVKSNLFLNNCCIFVNLFLISKLYF